MALGLFLILIVIIPFCIYLYITNKQLKIKITELELEKKKILERKIMNHQEKDTIPIARLKNNTSNMNTKKNEEYLEKVSKDLNENKRIIDTAKYEQREEENAVISYQELKSLEKKIKIDSNDKAEDFINNLKEFRSNLKDYKPIDKS